MNPEPKVDPPAADADETKQETAAQSDFDLRQELIELGEGGKELLSILNRHRDVLFDAVKGSATAARDKVSESTNRVLRKADKALDRVAIEPFDEMSFRKKVGREVLALAPIVGRSKDWADARVRYRYAKVTDNDTMMLRARRDGFYVLLGLGFDGATLGAGAVGHSAALATRSPAVANFLKNALKLPMLGTVGRVVRIPGLKSLSPLVDELMKNDYAKDVMDKLLTARPAEENEAA